MTHSLDQFHFEVSDEFEQFLSNEALLCSICMSVPKIPQTSTACCGMAILCKDCISEYYSKGKTQCPTCNKYDVRSQHFIINLRVQKTIKQLRAKCTTCDFGKADVKTLDTVLFHQEKECDFRIEKCSHCTQDVLFNKMEEHLTTTCISTCSLCAESMISSTMNDHKRDTCPMRTVNCAQGCPHMIRVDKMQDHIIKWCEKTRIECYNKCGLTFQRYEYAQHEMKCDFVLTTCPTCDYKCKRVEMVEHMKDRLFHVEFRMTKMEKENARLIEENKVLGSLLPVYMPSYIDVRYRGKMIRMTISDLPNNNCDFCKDTGTYVTIPVIFGMNYGYHFENTDICLSCVANIVPVTPTTAIASAAAAASDSNRARVMASVQQASFGDRTIINLPTFTYNITGLDAKRAVYKHNTVVHFNHTNMIGCFVTEGPDWRWANQAGPSKTGTIISMADTPGWVRIKWHTAEDDEPLSNTYRIGGDSKFDLAYINDDDERIPRTSRTF